MAVKRIGIDLTGALVVDRDNRIVEAGVAVWSFDGAAVSAVVEETGGIWLRD